jgi:hypothetical protein
LVAGAGFGPAGCLLSGVAITFANDVPEAQNCILANLSYDCFPDGLARAGTAYLGREPPLPVRCGTQDELRLACRKLAADRQS